MKKVVLAIALLGTIGLTSCNKCHECHYETSTGAEVEIGEYCGAELEAIEESGYNVDGSVLEVHCEEH